MPGSLIILAVTDIVSPLGVAVLTSIVDGPRSLLADAKVASYIDCSGNFLGGDLSVEALGNGWFDRNEERFMNVENADRC